MSERQQTRDDDSKKTVKIVLVDDHVVIREGIRKILEEDPAFCVVGEAHDGHTALACCKQVQPDVVVLDIAMKGMNGFDAVRALSLQMDPPPAILVLTAYDQVAYVQTMLKLGVKG